MSKKSLIIRCTDLAEELGVSRSSIWRMRQTGDIPVPIKLGSRVVGWEREIIENWLKSKRIQGE